MSVSVDDGPEGGASLQGLFAVLPSEESGAGEVALGGVGWLAVA